MKEIIKLEPKPMKNKTEKQWQNQSNQKFALWKDYKIDKLLARLIKKKRINDQLQEWKMCITTNATEVKSIMREYYELCQ